MPTYSCLMEDGALLQVADRAFSFGPKPKSRQSRLDAAIHAFAAMVSLLLGLLFAYIGAVMLISFFRDNHDWVILPISLCFGGFGCFTIALFPHLSSKGIHATLKADGTNTTVTRIKTWPFRLQRTIHQAFPTSECRLMVIPNHNTKHDEHSFMLCIVHGPSATEVDLTDWLQPKHIDPSSGINVRREAEECAQAIKGANLVAEINFTEHWRAP